MSLTAVLAQCPLAKELPPHLHNKHFEMNIRARQLAYRQYVDFYNSQRDIDSTFKNWLGNLSQCNGVLTTNTVYVCRILTSSCSHTKMIRALGVCVCECVCVCVHVTSYVCTGINMDFVCTLACHIINFISNSLSSLLSLHWLYCVLYGLLT